MLQSNTYFHINLTDSTDIHGHGGLLNLHMATRHFIQLLQFLFEIIFDCQTKRSCSTKYTEIEFEIICDSLSI